ncbi:MAG: hypothetical protein JWP11_1347 [Frankiales bacterium]|nr:hypothetical protein [Frankiales bacterium]
MTLTIPVPTHAAVKASLFTGLTALNLCTIFYDDPTTDLEDDWISLGATRGTFLPQDLVGTGGAGWLREAYTLDVEISSFRGDDDPQATYERCAVLMAAVVDYVRQDPTLGGLINIQVRPDAFEVDPAWEDEHLGRICRILLTLAVENRI